MHERWSTCLRGALTGLLFGALTACSEPSDESGTPIGALVPFTGVSAVGGPNYERAMLLATEYLNSALASSGRRFRMVVQDSHSTRERTLSALDKLLAEDVIGLIGPDRVELVQAVREQLSDRELSQILPSSMTFADFPASLSRNLIRPAPAAEVVGCALSNRIYGDLDRILVVMHSGDAYRTAFAAATVDSFESYRFAAHVGIGHAVLLPASGDYRRTISYVAGLAPDTVVVAADAPVGAGLVRAWSTVTPRPVKWFFEPALRSEEFVRNVNPRSVEGSTGISLALPDASSDFVSVYENRWDGETPLVESHLYFDAVIATGLATLVAARELGREPTAAEVAGKVLRVVRGPGRSVSWQELDRAVALINEGTAIHYIGAAGRWALDAQGAPEATSALFGFWRIQGGSIVAERFGACPAGTIGSAPR
jgi:ABC-type branched-subunit amino acid transport system substrate-binding protein